VIHWLMDASETLEEIVVEARYGALSGVENTQLGAMSLPPALVKSVPAILGEVDLVKVLQQTPGVSAGTEGFSGLYVRGGNRDENLYLIDGNPVFDVNHLFGFFSTFNTDAVKSTEFYKGSFPARFGGRLSSVGDVRMKDGNMQDYHGLFTVELSYPKLCWKGRWSGTKPPSVLPSAARISTCSPRLSSGLPIRRWKMKRIISDTISTT
jgi:hypothetical protein